MSSWMLQALDRLGYAGVALLMCLENLFPPIPSEIIMPLAGVLAAEGRLSLPGAIAAGTAGSLLGQTGWYWLGCRVGARRLRHLAERHGRWLTVGPKDIDDAHDWLVRHGAGALVLGRLVPTVRTLISLPAGMAAIPLWRFLAYSSVGTAAWTALLAVAGYLLRSQFARVHAIVGPVSTAVVVTLVVWYLWRVLRHPVRR